MARAEASRAKVVTVATFAGLQRQGDRYALRVDPRTSDPPRPDQPEPRRSSDTLFDQVYAQLRAIAAEHMGRERPGHSLQATGLVNEAYLRLARDREAGWTSLGQFYAAAAEAMRRILIEHARLRGRVKRGGGRRCVPLSVLDLAAEQDHEQILSLDAAVRRLEDVDRDAADVVRLRFFAGLSVDQTAEALGVSARTVKRDWAFARAWLHGTLQGEI